MEKCFAVFWKHPDSNHRSLALLFSKEEDAKKFVEEAKNDINHPLYYYYESCKIHTEPVPYNP